MELALVCWPGPSLTQPWGIRTQAGGGGQGALHSQPPKGPEQAVWRRVPACHGLSGSTVVRKFVTLYALSLSVFLS